MMVPPHRVLLRVVHFLVLVSLLCVNVAPLSVSPLTPQSVQAAPAAAPLSDLPPTTVPNDRHSTSLPASQALAYRQQYADRHAFNSGFDSTFSTPSTVTSIAGSRHQQLDGAYPVPSNTPTQDIQTLTFPAGIYLHRSLFFNITVSSTSVRENRTPNTVTALIRVRVPGGPDWSTVDQVVLAQVTGTSAAPVSKTVTDQHVTLGIEIPTATPLEVQFTCTRNSGVDTVICDWSQFRTRNDIPAWRTRSVFSETTKFHADARTGSSTVYPGTSAQATIPASDGAYLTFETTYNCSGANCGPVNNQNYRSPLVRLPQYAAGSFKATVQWARVITSTAGIGANPPATLGDAGGLSIDFMRMDGNTCGVLSIPSGNTSTPQWQTKSDAGPINSACSGQVGYFQIGFGPSARATLIAIDSLTFLLNGQAVKLPFGIPDGQLVNICPCILGANAQVQRHDPVNTWGGDFIESATDVTISNNSASLAFARTYVSSFRATSTTLGWGWRHTFEAALSGVSNELVTYQSPSGNRLTFEKTATSTGPAADYWGLPGVYATLKRASDGIFTLTLRDQSVQRFRSDGKLMALRDPQGHEQTLEYYEDNTSVAAANRKQLYKVKDTASGRTLFTFTYKTTN